MHQARRRLISAKIWLLLLFHFSCIKMKCWQLITPDAWESEICLVRLLAHFSLLACRYDYSFQITTCFLSRGFCWLGCKQIYFAGGGIPLIIEPPAEEAKPPTGRRKGTRTKKTVEIFYPSFPRVCSLIWSDWTSFLPLFLSKKSNVNMSKAIHSIAGVHSFSI